MVEAPLGFVKAVKQRNDFGILESSVAEPLADVSVVFAFDVSVIIFLIFSGASELDRGFTAEEIVHEEFVEKLLAVVAIEAEDGKGQRLFDILDLVGNVTESFAVGGALLGPVGGNIDRIGGDGVMTFDGGAAVSHSIGFQEAWAGLIPLIGFDGDVVFEKETGFGGRAAFATVELSDGLESLIDGRGGDFKEFLEDLLRKESVKLLVGTDPIRDRFFETFGADEVGGNPDFFKGLEEVGMLVLGFGARFVFRLPASWGLPVSKPTDGIFTVKAKVGANLIEDLRFFFSRGFLIT